VSWILYLAFATSESNSDSAAVLKNGAVLKNAERFSPKIEREETGVFLELRGPHTVFQVLKEFKEGAAIIALAPNKWLAKFLALTSNYYAALTELSRGFYLWRRKLGSPEMLWLGPGQAAGAKILPQDFYPSIASAREAWVAWFASNIWQALPLSGLWPLEAKIIEKLTRLGFRNLGQLALLEDDFLIRETKNPFLPLFLKGREGLPGLEVNYPSKFLELFCDLRDPETKSEGDRLQLNKALLELAFQLAEQLTLRNEGCLRLRLVVSHDGEIFDLQRCFSAPQQDRLSLAETVLLLAEQLEFESFEEVRLEAQELRPAVHKQYSLFAQIGKEMRDPHLAALALRFPGRLRKGVSLSRREKMLAYWDPWRLPKT